MIDWNQIPDHPASPDFNNLLTVLRREVPVRPTLFEFFLNDRLYQRLAPLSEFEADVSYAAQRQVMTAFHRLGYDYVTILVPGFKFPSERVYEKQTVSINAGGLIHDWESFAAYPWPDPEVADYDILNVLGAALPAGMKIICDGPSGVLENAIEIVGYERLCYWLADDPELVREVFQNVGSRLVQFYDRVAAHPAVGACIDNDDWGFKTQTMFSPTQMREFVFPWHRRIAEVVHAAGKPMILHSCGHFERIIDDMVEIGIDARHSYEDTILSVEEAYDRYHDCFAILGGIDLDFICRSTPGEVYARSKALLTQTADRGGYALGTGNSVADYVPDENYFAMIRAVLDLR
ncbi:MAG: uroporphyrinogen decarboxylase family protein [Chloroflexota bacterium]|nr:uroporphyrinogen decarboxylase family protein [Chloroflexota bacterium]